MGEMQRLTIDGKNYVLLSEDDYEDLIDGLRADVIMARVSAGEETWPHELVKELSETDSRIRTYRQYRGMTMMELAKAAGISQPHLSDIETGKKTGSVDALKRIATALRVDLDDLVPLRDSD
ncbi:DNA-binding XRE family transcriptional regulator [Rhizobium sp. SG_E_25_P2]|uniref:helix-turn-helix domain-containing protein n=1 Tax=Rhizobium sp. SG_E_25_P2 TaxID=2879942 RepID=UPI002473D4DB|nr:helix-turn-helix transcriptional regulator [Rhizobium sp. SG_E_25_P2]MDH6268447.1 DNA-binding XRE family transcriptional regulator [Rhizobium sp. SG_E_25_P2]